MQKFLANILGGVVLVLAGCDSLHARMIAGDAANLYRDGKLAEASAKYEEAARLDPKIAPIQLNIGFVNLARYQASPKGADGQEAAGKAIAAFERYLELKPNEERARSYLVQTFVDTARYDDAVRFYQPSIDKHDPEAFNTLAIIAQKTAKFPEARDWYQKRIDAEPKNADAYLALGVLIWDYLHNHKEVVGDQRKQLADDGIKTLNKAIEISPKAPNPYTYNNLLYRERSEAAANDDEKRVDLEQANAFFKKAVELQKAASTGSK